MTPPSLPQVHWDPTARLLAQTLSRQPWRAARVLLRRAGVPVRPVDALESLAPATPAWTVGGLLRAAACLARFVESPTPAPPEACRVEWSHLLRVLDIAASAEDLRRLAALTPDAAAAFRAARLRVPLALDGAIRTALRHLAVLPAAIAPTPPTLHLPASPGPTVCPSFRGSRTTHVRYTRTPGHSPCC